MSKIRLIQDMNKMATNIIKRLCQKDVIAILDGDKHLHDSQGNEVSMTYLTGSDIFALFELMNFETHLEYGASRWLIMQEFLERSIDEGRINESLTYIFEKINPHGVGVNRGSFKETSDYTIEVILNELNSILYNSNVSLKCSNKKIIVITDDAVMLDSPTMNEIIDLNYVHALKERCQDDFSTDNIDGVITKSRTMLEEVFIHIIGDEYDEKEYGGKIDCLFEKAKEKCNISKDRVPSSIKDIVASLNSIVNDIAQLRNNYSESHGVGRTRITLSKAEALLVVNSAITLGEYMLSVFQSSSLNDRMQKI